MMETVAESRPKTASQRTNTNNNTPVKKIKSALISVYSKENLAPIVKELKALGVKLYSTGGTQTYLEGEGAKVVAVEEVTSYPSIFGGRVKTLPLVITEFCTLVP